MFGLLIHELLRLKEPYHDLSDQVTTIHNHHSVGPFCVCVCSNLTGAISVTGIRGHDVGALGPRIAPGIHPDLGGRRHPGLPRQRRHLPPGKSSH